MNVDLYYNLLYSTLLANSPVDTGNMVSNIKQYDMGDHYLIVISGPKGNGDYAKFVNYNKQRSIKEKKNYKWVERTIHQVSELLGEVESELS